MIVEFEPWHLLEIRHQEWQRGGDQNMDHARAVAQGHCAYTAVCNKTGRPLICAGIIELWPNRAMCWASFDFEARPVMLEAHRRTMKEIDAAPFKRLEMYVVSGFLEGWRWANMIGFKIEGRMEAGAPDGRDLFVFKRIKHGKVVERLN